MPARRYRWARWGWLGSTLALGVALLMTAWVGRQHAVAAAETLNRGQADVWLEAVREVAREFSSGAVQSPIDSLLLVHGPAGLTGIAVFDGAGLPLVHAGVSIARPPTTMFTPGPQPMVIEELGSRIRLIGSAFIGRRDSSESDRPRPPRALAVIEFTPIAAQQLIAEATRTFLLSTAVALALLAAALLSWRRLVLHEVTERRLEQQQRLAMLGEMSAVLAHEIRNPLASLKGHAQLLAERLGEESPEGAKAELVVHEAERLEALTNDLLSFARSGPIDITPADPIAILQTCADDVEPDGFTIRTDGAPDSWPLDANRMQRTLTNILRNALQASPSERKPEASVTKEGGQLVYSVRDFGPGIPAGEETLVFQPFYTTRTSGTGLGLAVAARVAEMHEGTIIVSNHPDGGAVFRIAIPRAEA